MDSVADIISSTISRSNVHIVEMAESYKMAAGYLRMYRVCIADDELYVRKSITQRIEKSKLPL